MVYLVQILGRMISPLNVIAAWIETKLGPN